MRELLLFCIYLATNLATLLVTAAAKRSTETKFINSTAVTVGEAIKVAISVLMIWAAQRSRSPGELLATISTTLFGNPTELLKVCVPALLYTIQNNIIYVALNHIDTVTFQIVYQMKIVAAALAHRFLLGRRVSAQKWASILLLTLGVVLVQLSTMEANNQPRAASDGASTSSDNGAAEEPGGGDERKSRALGLACVLGACGCSGLAGAVMELLLKASGTSLPRRNLQMAVLSMVIATVHMLRSDRAQLREGGMFQGYTRRVWGMLMLDSVGGVLVSLLLKYTTATLKNFAAPLGIIINMLLSRIRARGDAPPPKPKFLVGAAMVILALGMFTTAPA